MFTLVERDATQRTLTEKLPFTNGNVKIIRKTSKTRFEVLESCIVFFTSLDVVHISD